MHIFVNGEKRSVESKNLCDLIKELQLSGKRIAIEMNLEIIPRSAFVNTLVQENDRIEIVQAIGGG